MAMFNLISNSFYGSVGQLVGQRWKNTTLLKTKSESAKIATESQIGSQETLTLCAKLTAISALCNLGAKIFKKRNRSEWQLRLKSAFSYLKKGCTGLDIVPLIPYGFSPKLFFRSLRVTSLQSNGMAAVEVTGNLPHEIRRMLILVSEPDQVFTPELIEIYPAEYLGGSIPSFIVPAPYGRFLRSNWLARVIAIDHTESEEKTLVTSALTIQRTIKPTTLFPHDTSLFIYENQYATIVLPLLYSDGYQNVGLCTLTYVKFGEWVSQNFSNVTIQNWNGYCSLSFYLPFTSNWSKPAFPVGSNLTVSLLELETSNYDYYARNIQFDFSDYDLVRTVNVQWSVNQDYEGMLQFHAPATDMAFAEQETVVGLNYPNSPWHDWEYAEVSAKCRFENDRITLSVVGVDGHNYAIPFPMPQNVFTIDFILNGVTYRINPLVSVVYATNKGTQFPDITWYHRGIAWDSDGSNKIWYPVFEFDGCYVPDAFIKKIYREELNIWRVFGGEFDEQETYWNTPDCPFDTWKEENWKGIVGGEFDFAYGEEEYWCDDMKMIGYNDKVAKKMLITWDYHGREITQNVEIDYQDEIEWGRYW